MKKTLYIVGIIIITLFCGCLNSKEITNIKILDKNFNVLLELKDKKDINIFKSYWEERNKINKLSHYNWDYKFDIQIEEESLRWLYCSDGFCALLNKQLQPSYEITRFKEFNNYLKQITN